MLTKILCTLALILSASAALASCPRPAAGSYHLGDSIEVEGLGDIRIFAETSTEGAELSVAVEEYGSFECLVSVEKLSPSCLLLEVSWLPGADSSGCVVTLKRDGEALGSSEIYMSY